MKKIYLNSKFCEQQKFSRCLSYPHIHSPPPSVFYKTFFLVFFLVLRGGITSRRVALSESKRDVLVVIKGRFGSQKGRFGSR